MFGQIADHSDSVDGACWQGLAGAQDMSVSSVAQALAVRANRFFVLARSCKQTGFPPDEEHCKADGIDANSMTFDVGTNPAQSQDAFGSSLVWVYAQT